MLRLSQAICGVFILGVAIFAQRHPAMPYVLLGANGIMAILIGVGLDSRRAAAIWIGWGALCVVLAVALGVLRA